MTLTSNILDLGAQRGEQREIPVLCHKTERRAIRVHISRGKIISCFTIMSFTKAAAFGLLVLVMTLVWLSPLSADPVAVFSWLFSARTVEGALIRTSYDSGRVGVMNVDATAAWA